MIGLMSDGRPKFPNCVHLSFHLDDVDSIVIKFHDFLGNEMMLSLLRVREAFCPRRRPHRGRN